MGLTLVDIFLMITGVCVLAGIMTFALTRISDALISRELPAREGPRVDAAAVLSYGKRKREFESLCQRYNVSFELGNALCPSESGRDILSFFSFGMSPELAKGNIENFSACTDLRGQPSVEDYARASSALAVLNAELPPLLELWQAPHMRAGKEIIIRRENGKLGCPSIPASMLSDVRDALELHYKDGIPLEDIAA